MRLPLHFGLPCAAPAHPEGRHSLCVVWCCLPLWPLCGALHRILAGLEISPHTQGR